MRAEQHLRLGQGRQRPAELLGAYQYRCSEQERLGQANGVATRPQDSDRLFAFDDADRRAGRHADAVAVPDEGAGVQLGTAVPFGAQRAGQPTGTFGKVGVDEPQPGHSGGHGKCGIDVPGGQVPIESGLEIAQLLVQTFAPHRRRATSEACVGVLGELAVVGGVPGANRVGLVGVVEAVGAVLRQRLQLGEPGLAG